MFPVDPSGNPLVGPVSHGKTVSLAVHPWNSRTVGITGWPTVLNNGGTETIYVSGDAGNTWIEISGNLVNITGTIGKVRPSGLIFVPVQSVQNTAVFVGTTRGIYFTWLNGDSVGIWQRFGSCVEFPIVPTMELNYMPEQDLLVVATFGRGIYALSSVSQYLARC